MASNPQQILLDPQGRQRLIEHDAGEITITPETSRILRESFQIKEGKGIPSGPLYVPCILQKADIENRNKRIYPKPVLERELIKYQELIRDRNSYGETNHPDSSSVSLKDYDMSHLVTEAHWDGDTVVGTLEILTSFAFHQTGHISCIGDFVATLLLKDCKLGISSRGLGSLKKIQGKNYVQDDFELIAFDLVSSPSTKGAFLYYQEPKLNESYIPVGNVLNSKLQDFLGR